ncbi:single-stranded DNA-binding protein, partial [Snodgrassella sp. CFCC 13594]|uniref:single-stranded DNA-binding protein n=1 Tax=Snodgrassella sp. CFCC 13594 TaxID=1775559 RepID=UPI000AE45DAC
SDKRTGQTNEKTDWFAALLYGRHAELVCQHMDVGDSIYVRGPIRSRRYEQDGIQRTVWEIHVDKFIMMGRKEQP